ncbi:MAG: rod shape-determining protein RodA [Treponemataceae bacterium]
MNKNFANFDYLLFIAVVALSFIGVLFIYSSGVNSDGILTSREYTRQIVWACTGLVLLLGVAFYDYNKLKEYSIFIYGTGILLLVYTLFFGRVVNASKSWIGFGNLGIQPSEFMKVAYIVFLAFYLERSQKELELRRFIRASLITAIPMLLILLQPDLGTASVYIPIFFIMSFVAGIKLQYLAFVFFVLIFGLLALLFPIWEFYVVKEVSAISRVLTSTKYSLSLFAIFFVVSLMFTLGYFLFRKKYYYWLSFIFFIFSGAVIICAAGLKVLKPYQMMRLIVFLDPNIDALNSGWHINQSMIAIGAGGLRGTGFLQGTQSHYKFLPEQSTDFIFSILSEEWGFIGGLLVFSLYALIFYRIRNTALRCADFFGKLVCMGILSIFVYHFFINIGMAMGIMPVMGIPLLFLSYGGSSIWAAMLAIGIVVGINLRQL